MKATTNEATSPPQQISIDAAQRTIAPGSESCYRVQRTGYMTFRLRSDEVPCSMGETGGGARLDPREKAYP